MYNGIFVHANVNVLTTSYGVINGSVSKKVTGGAKLNCRLQNNDLVNGLSTL